MASLKDIAEEVGVSVSLVSKVLNDRLGTTGAGSGTVAAIRGVAERVGYRKNASALALLAGRHHVIGVYIHCIGMAGSGILEHLLGGISSMARQHRQRQMLSFFETTQELLDLCDAAHAGTMDGLLLGGLVHPEACDRILEIRRVIPVVTIYDEPLHPGLVNVGLDQTRVARVATAHLVERGARAIAHIHNVGGRSEGYRQALADAGLAYEAARVYSAPSVRYDHETGERAVEAFIERGVAFDGIVAQSDQQAVGCINALARHGLRVPDDVRVIGVDDAPYCTFNSVPLSSVDQGFRQRGETAVRMLLDMVNGKTVHTGAIAPRLVVRESTR